MQHKVLIATLLSVGTAGAASAQNAQPPAGPAPTVEAVRIADGEGRFRDGQDREIPQPPIAQLFQAPAMPMGMPDMRNLPFVPGGATVYDAETGQTGELPAFPQFGDALVQGGGYTGADGLAGAEPSGRGFGTMSEINATDAFPWRVNCKLLMRFGGSYFVCSGSMIDAEVILTAAHCVYDRGGSGWADEIWVFPGWDGAGDMFNPDVMNSWGWARSTYYGAGSNYINNGDWDADVGFVNVTRAAGMLTGWFGWAYGGSCGWLTSTTMNNSSYPSEGCGSPGMHNGRDMYYWFGGVDDCPGNQAELDTSPGCFTAVWGGMSGSSMYYIDGDNRYSHAVCSTSDRAFVGRYARLWQGIVDFMNNTMIPDARGNTLDVQALDANFTPASITAGNTMSVSDFLLTNPTNNDPATRTYTWTTRLSTNNTISSSDTSLGTWNLSWNLPAMGSVRIGMSGVTIPSDTPSGTYWLGVLLDPSTDGDTSNNATHDWDAVQITVTGLPDLEATTVNATNGPLFTGDDINISYSVRNNGSESSSGYSVSFRASTNTTISVADFELGTASLGGLSAGQTRNSNSTFELPVGLNPGTYYIGIIVTPNTNNEYDGNNNTNYDATSVVVNGRADLEVPTVNATNGTYSTCELVPVSVTFENNGNAPSGPFTADFRLSVNTAITVADPLMEVRNFASIAAGGSLTQTVNVRVPLSATSGPRYLGVIVNGTNELSTSNNTGYDATQITIAACPADVDCSGGLTLSDFVAFRNLYVAGNMAADFDGNGSLTLADFVAFRNAYTAGCP